MHLSAPLPKERGEVYTSLPSWPTTTARGTLCRDSSIRISSEQDSYWSLFILEEVRRGKVIPRGVCLSLKEARKQIELIALQLDSQCDDGFWLIFDQGDIYVNQEITLRIRERRY